MKYTGMPITWKEIEELGLEEVPPGYELSDNEQPQQNQRKEYEKNKYNRSS